MPEVAPCLSLARTAWQPAVLVPLLLVLLWGCAAGRGTASTHAAVLAPNRCRTNIVAPAPPGAPLPAEFADFARFREAYVAAATEERRELARAFVAQQQAAGGFPLKGADGTVVFFYSGTGSEREVLLAGDFWTGGPHTVYWRKEGQPLMRIVEGAPAFVAQLRVEPDARLDYQFVVDGRPGPDPLNPTRVTSGPAGNDAEASALVMPMYPRRSHAAVALGAARGTLQVLAEPWASPRVTIHLPAGYSFAKRYPVLYTADGTAWKDIIQLPALLDALTSSGEIPPVIAVMIDAPADRGGWYSYNPQYLAYLEKVVGYVDAHFSTRAAAHGRFHIGTSAGARAALYAALERPRLLGGVGILSPSLGNAVYYYAPYLSGERRLPSELKVWLSGGSYEGALCEDARVLEHLLGEAGVAVRSRFPHAGHSFGVWRDLTVEALKFLLAE